MALVVLRFDLLLGIPVHDSRAAVRVLLRPVTYLLPPAGRDPQLLAASGPIADPCLPVDHADRPDDDQPEAHQQQHGEEWAECMEDWQDDEEGDADQQQQQGLGQGAEHGEQGTGCCGGSGRKGEGEGCCGGGGERKGAEGRAQGEAERCSGRGAGSEGEGPSGEAADAVAAAAAAALRARKRSTLCVSSQVGCQMGCTFCATGGRRAACWVGRVWRTGRRHALWVMWGARAQAFLVQSSLSI